VTSARTLTLSPALVGAVTHRLPLYAKRRTSAFCPAFGGALRTALFALSFLQSSARAFKLRETPQVSPAFKAAGGPRPVGLKET
jgi:hypothetical protein